MLNRYLTATSASFASTAISSSYAATASLLLGSIVSASYASKATDADYVYGYYQISSSAVPTVQSGSKFQMIAGSGTMTGGIFTSAAFPILVGKHLGDTAFITANTVQISYSNGLNIILDSSTGVIEINNSLGSGTAYVVFTGFVLLT